MYDHIGLGFGPANLALCISLHENEEARARGFTMCFLEQQSTFAWHPSLLLPGAQLQVSPLKDLVTMRDPTSSSSFLNFLHSEGRLMQYINREEKVPSRREWSAYLAWAAHRMQQYVQYGRRVVDVVPVEHGHTLDHYRVICEHVETGEKEEFLARNLSMAAGGSPQLPHTFQSLYTWPRELQSRVVHSASFLPHMAKLAPVLQAASQPLRFAVIGGGQSSAEMLLYLRDRFPTASIDMILRASALVPSDDSPFVNSAAFDPASVTTFWESSARQRHAQLAEFKRTNYSVIRSDLLQSLYEVVYDQDIDYSEPGETPKGLVRILASTELVTVEQQPNDQIRIDTCTNMGDLLERSETYDAVFLGTGFRRDPSLLPFVHTLSSYFPLLSVEGAEALRERELALDEQVAKAQDPEAMRAKLRGITRDYRLVAHDHVSWAKPPSALPESVIQRIPCSRIGIEGQREPSLSRNGSESSTRASTPPGTSASASSSHSRPAGAIYMFGSNEHTHGLSDSLMSMVAHRAGIVTASLLAAYST
ncbi:taxifolin 8-monooxygenase [Malassezia pachydermatis]|uniref:L-ornithine N(5)-monooxygenase [NAD(P)H] n=1 Tax=Malassezia pachydermatis TaxID=77020 RepID=A0A0M9VP28_9BASI|nr:hypothetical protein Malapachy_3928 [Malassezia pachydermatis]KOS13985.1 hypothetical protein Malapachy_3928 [Malassezia pachydermatis]